MKRVSQAKPTEVDSIETKPTEVDSIETKPTKVCFSLTERQKQLISDFKRGKFRRINILEGSVRSGKTFVSLIIWALYLAQGSKNGRYLMAGRTLSTLKRNCLEPLQALLGESNMVFSTSSKRALIFGRQVELEGASNALSESRIRGMTLSGAYLDEITLLPRDFFAMLLSRLSEPRAMLIGTTNPDSPRHWLKRDYLDRRDLDLYRSRFLLTDNTALPADYVRNLSREYSGLYRRRFIGGEWVAAEGAVFPMFDLQRHVSSDMPPMKMCWLAADYGHTNPTAFLRLGVGEDKCIWVTDEYYHQSASGGSKSPRQYARDLRLFAQRGLEPARVVIDPAAEGFILQLREEAPNLRVRRADNRVSEGLQLVSSALEADILRIHPRCRRLIEEMQGYRWDSRAQEAGVDKPVKADDHAVDALRYALMAYRKEISRRVMNCDRKEPLPPDQLALARL